MSHVEDLLQQLNKYHDLWQHLYYTDDITGKEHYTCSGNFMNRTIIHLLQPFLCCRPIEFRQTEKQGSEPLRLFVLRRHFCTRSSEPDKTQSLSKPTRRTLVM